MEDKPMTDKKRASGLGRGLAALLEEIGSEARSPEAAPPQTPAGPPTVLPISRIHPNPRQPRRHFDPAAMAELVDSIKATGLLQPILVRERREGDYEIVAGERRWRAAQMAQLHEVPVVVRNLADGDAFQVALIENVQRADLNPIEEAEGYRRLVHEYGYVQDDLQRVTGKSRSHVANLLRLLNLPPAVLDAVRDGRLTMGHARALVGHPDAERLADRIIRDNLSVRETEALVAGETGRERQSRPRGAKRGEKDADTAELERALSDALGLKVAIDGPGPSGRVHIDYANLDQLDMLAQRLIGGRF
jgi:ParB family transcriptional regulator, chromosome partitioning protein